MKKIFLILTLLIGTLVQGQIGSNPSYFKNGVKIGTQPIETSTDSLNIVLTDGTIATIAISDIDLSQFTNDIGGLIDVDEGNGIGHRLFLSDPANFANIGLGAIDLATNSGVSSVWGATGSYSLNHGQDNTGGSWAGITSGYNNSTHASANTAGTFGQDNIVDEFGGVSYLFGQGNYSNAAYGFGTGWLNTIDDPAIAGFVTGQENTVGSYASTVHGVYNQETSTSLGFNFVGGQGTIINSGATFAYGPALLQNEGVGVSILGSANAPVSATESGSAATNPMIIVGNGTHTTTPGTPWTSAARSNLMVGLRNGEVTLPSTDIAVIDGEATGKQILTREWYESQTIGLNTGVTTGGEVTINGGDDTLIDIAAGTGFIADWTVPSAPTFTKYSWGAQIGVALPNIALGFTNVYMVPSATPNIAEPFLESGTIITPNKTRTCISLQAALHLDGVAISIIGNSSTPSYQTINAVLDYIYSLGTINKGNNYFESGANLEVDKTTGESVLPFINRSNSLSNPTELTNGSLVATSLIREYRDGAGGWTIMLEPDVNPEQYDDGSGVLATVGNNRFTIQRFYFFGQTNATIVTYGQVTYGSLAEAEGEIFHEAPTLDPILEGATFTTALIVKKGVTNLTTAVAGGDASFVNIASAFSSPGGGQVGNFVTADSDQLTGLTGNKTWDGVHIFNGTNTSFEIYPSSITGYTSSLTLGSWDSASEVIIEDAEPILITGNYGLNIALGNSGTPYNSVVGQVLTATTIDGKADWVTPNTVTETLGEATSVNDLLYLKSDGKFWLADATDDTKSTTELALSTTVSIADDVEVIIRKGLVSGWTGLVQGDKYYIDISEGLLTNDFSSFLSGSIVRYIGTADSTTTLYFNPSQTSIEIN